MGLLRIRTLAVCAAWALLIAPLAAFAGAQVEEQLAPSVVAGLARSIADNPVPGDYAYRTNIAWWAFAVAGVGAALVALLTITLQTIRTALASPIKSLRTE